MAISVPTDTNWDKVYPKELWDAFLQDLEEETAEYIDEVVETIQEITSDETIVESVQRLLEINKYHSKKDGKFVSKKGGPSSAAPSGGGPTTAAVQSAVGGPKMSATVGVVKHVLGPTLSPMHTTTSGKHGGVNVSYTGHDSDNPVVKGAFQKAVKAHLEGHGAVVKAHESGDLHVSHFSNPSDLAKSQHVAKTKGAQKPKIEKPKAEPPKPKTESVAANRENTTKVLETAGHKVYKDYSSFQHADGGDGVHLRPHTSGSGVFLQHTGYNSDNAHPTKLAAIKASLEKAGAQVSYDGVGLHVTHVQQDMKSAPKTVKPGEYTHKDLELPHLPSGKTGEKYVLDERDKPHSALSDLGMGISTQDATYKAKIQDDLSERLKNHKEFGEFAQKFWPQSEVSSTTPVREAVRGLIGNWASTSGDTNDWAVSMQHAIKQEFGLKEAGTGHMTAQVMTSEIPAMRAFARQMYEHTQEHLKKQGIDKVLVYRGVNGTGGEGLTFEGVLNKGKVRTQPASSWSYEFGTARTFATTYSASAVLSAFIPRERILGTFRTGFGCRGENEIVVLGGVDEVGVYGAHPGGHHVTEARDMLFK